MKRAPTVLNRFTRRANAAACAILLLAIGLPATAQVGIGLGNRSSNGSGVGFGTSGYKALPPGKPKPPEVTPTGAGVKNFFHADAAATGPDANLTPETLTDAQLVQSINRGIEFLLAHRNKINWERANHGVAGSPVQGFDTASILYCLLQVGDAMHDPRLVASAADIAPALRWLAPLNPPLTDTVGLQGAVLAIAAERPEYKAPLSRVTHRLLAAAHPDGGYGFWMVSGSTGQGWESPTYANGISSQLATIAVLAAGETGVAVPDKFWTTADRFWRKAQNADGGWCYGMAGKNSPHDHHRPAEDGAAVAASNLALTSGGAATLTLIKRHLPDTDWASDPALQHAGDYLTAHLDPHDRQTLFELSFYRGTGLDALGLFEQHAGTYYPAKTATFRQLAAALIRSQNADGSWNTPADPIGTAYAILFLARGHIPIFVEKLAYDGPWNAHPHDISGANWVLRHRFERPLRWRTVSIHTHAVDWMPAPVLWITGHGDPKFSPDDIAKLSAYVLTGGTILSSADGGDAAFSAAMRQYAVAVGGSQYPIRDLPAAHGVFTASSKVSHLRLEGVSNGTRELWIHSPTDLGALWQSGTGAPPEALALAENLFVYITGKKELPPPLRPPLLSMP